MHVHVSAAWHGIGSLFKEGAFLPVGDVPHRGIRAIRVAFSSRMSQADHLSEIGRALLEAFPVVAHLAPENEITKGHVAAFMDDRAKFFAVLVVPLPFAVQHRLVDAKVKTNDIEFNSVVRRP